MLIEFKGKRTLEIEKNLKIYTELDDAQERLYLIQEYRQRFKERHENRRDNDNKVKEEVKPSGSM